MEMRFLKSTCVDKVIICFCFLCRYSLMTLFLSFPSYFKAHLAPHLWILSLRIWFQNTSTQISRRGFFLPSSPINFTFHYSPWFVDFHRTWRIKKNIAHTDNIGMYLFGFCCNNDSEWYGIFSVVSNRHDRHFFWDHDLTYWSFDLMLLSFQFGNKKQKKY